MPLTPVEWRAGRWYKRDDAYRGLGGVNGGKWRQCRWLIGEAQARGATRVVSGASVLSPQLPMTATAAAELGMDCTLVIGGTTPEDAAAHHPGVRIAAEQGAEFVTVPVGYNPALQAQVARLVAADPGAYQLRYGVTIDPAAPFDELAAFHGLGAAQVENLPPDVHELIVPFGSGNSAASVLLGLAQGRAPQVQLVRLVGIGPDKRPYLEDRLERLGAPVDVNLVHHDLHGQGLVSYHHGVPYTSDGVVLHPTYEGKVASWLDGSEASWRWTHRDGTACLWVVGGPLGPVPEEWVPDLAGLA